MSLIVISDRPGRLCNLLIVYTHFIAFSLEYNHSIINPAFTPYKHYFTSTSLRRIPSFNLSAHSLEFIFPYNLSNVILRFLNRSSFSIPFLLNQVSLDFDSSIDLNLSASQLLFNNRLTFTGGWLYRCNTLVKKYKSVITNYFQPLDTYNSLALDLVSKARNHCQSNLLLGVHIRRGDYRYFQGGKYYFPISFYKSFIQKINSLSSLYWVFNCIG